MGPVIQFEVWGLPGPQGSKSFKGINRRTGKAILTESSKKVAPWRDQVVYMARAHLNRTYARWSPITGPVHLVIEFALPRQKDAPKTRRTLPDVTPDLSKLLRATEDALTTAGVWEDDARVVDTTGSPDYCEVAYSLAHAVSKLLVGIPAFCDTRGASGAARPVFRLAL